MFPDSRQPKHWSIMNYGMHVDTYLTLYGLSFRIIVYVCKLSFLYMIENQISPLIAMTKHSLFLACRIFKGWKSSSHLRNSSFFIILMWFDLSLLPQEGFQIQVVLRFGKIHFHLCLRMIFTLQQLYLNTSTMIAYQIHTNFSGRPDLALTYYPSQMEFYWFVARTYSQLQRQQRKSGLPHPVSTYSQLQRQQTEVWIATPCKYVLTAPTPAVEVWIATPCK